MCVCVRVCVCGGGGGGRRRRRRERESERDGMRELVKTCPLDGQAEYNQPFLVVHLKIEISSE